MFSYEALYQHSIVLPGEVLVRLDDAPAFPAALGEPAVTAIDDNGDVYWEPVPRFRRSVAQWLGVLIEASSSRFPDSAVHFEWQDDDVLIIHYAGWANAKEKEDGSQRVHPDTDGRYVIDGWLWNYVIDDDVAALTATELAALRYLTTDKSPQYADTMLAYFEDPDDVDYDLRAAVTEVLRRRWRIGLTRAALWWWHNRSRDRRRR